MLPVAAKLWVKSQQVVKQYLRLIPNAGDRYLFTYNYMKKRKVWLLPMLFAAMLIISITTGNSHSLQAASSLGKDTLTMITSPDYPPYEFYDTQGGERKSLALILI
jgi:hypothetical protein